MSGELPSPLPLLSFQLLGPRIGKWYRRTHHKG